MSLTEWLHSLLKLVDLVQSSPSRTQNANHSLSIIVIGDGTHSNVTQVALLCQFPSDSYQIFIVTVTVSMR